MFLLKAVIADSVLVTVICVYYASGDATTLLKNAIKGSCYIYVYPQLPPSQSKGFCSTAAEAFIQSLRNVNPGDPKRVPPPSHWYFMEYFNATLFPMRIVNNSLFFSTTQTLVTELNHLYPNLPYEGLSTIYGSKIIDYLHFWNVNHWCIDQNRKIFINHKCFYNNVARKIFWKEASVLMAMRVSGKSFFLTSNGHFSRNSDFERLELPYLIYRAECNAITVLNVVTDNKDHKCRRSQNLRRLQNKTRGKLTYKCLDITHFDNIDHPNEEQIQRLLRIIANQTTGVPDVID